jgi:hypothetical protein
MKSQNDNHPPEPVRFSRLKKMALSAAHFAEGFGPETAPMRKGSALHAYLLGGEKNVAVYTEGARNPNFGKWKVFQAQNAGKHILIPSELATVAGMRKSLERHTRAMALLDGIQERRIEWTDAGRACMGTPDVVIPKNGRTIGVELKTCVTSHPERFVWQCRKMNYHAQCAWYKRGIELCGNYQPALVDEFFVVVVESAPPYPVTVFKLDQESLEAGAKMNRLWLEQLLVCERNNHFPAYAESDVLLSVVETETELDWSETADEGEAA